MHRLMLWALCFFTASGQDSQDFMEVGVVNRQKGRQSSFHTHTGAASIQLHTNASVDHPLFVVLKSRQDIYSWSLPRSTSSGTIRQEHKTICLRGYTAISISTEEEADVAYNISISSIQRAQLQIGQPHLANIPAGDMQQRYVTISNDVRGVVIKVDSNDSVCAIVSLQFVNCTHQNSRIDGDDDDDDDDDKSSVFRKQTMTKQATITVTRPFRRARNLPVLIRIPVDDAVCRKNLDKKNKEQQNKTKTVRITVELLDRSSYWAILYFPLIVVIIAVTVLILCVWPPVAKYMQYPAKPVDGRPNLVPKNPEHPNDLVKGSFSMSLIVIAVLYSLPALQLLLSNQESFYETGEEDTCYYNFRCLRPLGPLAAFNNVYSNAGYAIFGVFFLLLVLYHKRRFTWRYREIFYSLGLALILEGGMSAGYHVCPSATNFQFDTTFMYIIAVLCIYHLYHIRNPSRPGRPHMAYGVVACAVFYVVLSLLSEHRRFLIALTIVYALSAVCIGIFVTKRIYLNNEELEHTRRLGYLLTALHVVINVLLVGYSCYVLVTRHIKFASILLYLFIGNMFYFSLFYFAVKKRNKEVLVVGSFVCVVVSLFAWAFSLYFFMMRKVNQWSMSPARSRELNKECVFLDFFDDHDVWHMLSAFSIFISFTLLLVLDATTELGSGGRTRLPGQELHRVGDFVMSTVVNEQPNQKQQRQSNPLANNSAVRKWKNPLTGRK